MRILARLSQYLQVLGLPGLFLIALLDSAAIPLPGGPEALITVLAWRRPAEMLLISMTAAVGSTVGCLVLYRLARAGGDMAMARIPAEKVVRVRKMVERNALWAVFMAVALPPPIPTKPVILAAGAFRAPVVPFGLAVFTGRVVRYTLLAYLAARFGDEAARIIKARYPWVALILIAAIAIFLIIRRCRRPRPQ